MLDTTMQDYRQLEAFQLARGLLAGVCTAVPRSDAGRPIHRAAVAAAARIADGTGPGSPASRSGCLEEAQASLAELGLLLRAAEEAGALSPDLAAALLERRDSASRALDSLTEATAEPPQG